MATYYDLNKDKILNYKKEFYKTNVKNAKYSYFKNIKINGYTKRQSATLIKQVLISNNLLIAINETTHISVDDFIKKYKFKNYSVIELEGYDETDSTGGCCVDIPYNNIIHYYDKNSAHDLVLSVWDNMLIEIN